ncbi:glycoside hydrolase family 64 protein [Neohortaea acidophila]|uniref:Glycoside hydrolase family 64 protein n=1 Tax=Neohortaea acidophila TaxID=245834 RepID=A0A6A6PT18_9PEZI|nr:glycoside hydrolase family 64 protein [Neohortaea acidophila]KAF2483248.1 glycoside hydrolase family 64 protein [Neohortaea acidophila]
MQLSNLVQYVLMAFLICNATASPFLTVHPGTAKDLVISKSDTVNATAPAPVVELAPRAANVRELRARMGRRRFGKFGNKTSGKLPLSIVNNLPGSHSLNVYVTGLDSSSRLVMLRPNGKFFYPTVNETATTPQPIKERTNIRIGRYGTTTNITIPDWISSARVWVADGELKFFTVYVAGNTGPSLVEPSAVNPSDPSADVNWGFVELTNTKENGLFANISYVDFVGLVLGMSLVSRGGPVQTAEGLSANAVSVICDALAAQAEQDGQPWGNLCLANSAGTPLRVISPNDFISISPNAFQDYWSSYVDEMWTYYAKNNLTINTQSSAGNVNCSVSNGTLYCAGDNRGYAQPTAGDIFGCNSGPFQILSTDNLVHKAVVPRLCAAFTRTTLMLNGGQVQPALNSTNYYTTEPTSYYSKFVHENEMDGKGYAFSYDDVTPDTAINQAGVVADPRPELLTIVVGGPLSESSVRSSNSVVSRVGG